jgi:hypothetical protein
MKPLIAISSCGDFESNGCNQAMRDTWLKDAVALGLPYKFFFGTGQGEPPPALGNRVVEPHATARIVNTPTLHHCISETA